MNIAKQGIDGLGGRLSLAIKLLGLSQAEFAQSIGTSPGYLSTVINGKCFPGSEFLAQLRSRFDINLDWLITGKGGMSNLAPIDVEWFRVIWELVQITNAATAGNEDAQNALVALSVGADDAESFELLRGGNYSGQSATLSVDDWRLAIQIYNTSIYGPSHEMRLRAAASFLMTSAALDSKAKWSQVSKALDSISNSPVSRQPQIQPTQFVQNAVARNVKVAGRSFVTAQRKYSKEKAK